MVRGLRKFISLVLIICILFISGCAGLSVEEKDQFPVVVGDVQILEKPLKLVSLAPSITTTLYSLGYGSFVVGVDDRSEKPSAVAEIEDCGTVLMPDANKIVSLGTDVVFSPTNLPEKEANILLSNGIPIVVLERGNTPEEMANLFHNVVTTVEGLNKGNAAREQLTFYSDNTMNYVYNSMKEAVNGEYSAIYIAEMSFNLATSDTFMGQVLENSGFINQAGGEYTNWNFPAEMEADLNPDYIFYASDIPLEEITSSPYYKLTKAVQNGNLIPLDRSIIEEQSPYIFEYLYLMFKENFPDSFTGERPSITMPIPEPEPETFWDKITGIFN